MSTVQQVIEVSAPLHTVYEQLISFESYPRFMSGVERVTRLSDDRTHWVMDLEGERREFDAQIVERSPDQRVAWRATDGPMLGETITLRPIGETRTQVVAQIEADIAALMPTDRHAQESLNQRLRADLAGLKRLVEQELRPAREGITNLASPASVANRIRRPVPGVATGPEARPATEMPNDH